MKGKDTERSSGKYTDQMKMIHCCIECCLFRQSQQSAMLIIKEYRKKNNTKLCPEKVLNLIQQLIPVS